MADTGMGGSGRGTGGLFSAGDAIAGLVILIMVWGPLALGALGS